MRIILYSVLLYLVVGSLPLSAQTIVANINQSNDGSNPQSLQADGRYAVFTVFEGKASNGCTSSMVRMGCPKSWRTG